MDPVLAAAFYIILWWLCFFLMLPIGVRSLHEAGEAAPDGHDRGAPAMANIRKKALWAAALAGAIWIIGAVTLSLTYYAD